MNGRFAGLVVVVSGLAALAGALLSRGIGEGGIVALAAGLVAALLSAFGIVALARFVIVSEREARRR